MNELYERRVGVVSFDRRLSATAVTYDRAGRVKRNWLPYFTDAGRVYWNELFYDGLGRVIEERKASRQVTRTAYGGLTTTVTNALGHDYDLAPHPASWRRNFA